VKIFNWLATMWRGSMTFETPMLWSVGFLFVFTMAASPADPGHGAIDIQIQDTYYVVAHFHYVLVAGSLFALFAGVYFWAPSGPASCTPRRAARSTSGLAGLLQRHLFPMHFLGLAGMPRRYADYRCSSPTSTPSPRRRLRLRAHAGLLLRLRRHPMMRGQGQKAPQRPWEAAEGLEWEVPSPAPWHTFETPPKLDASATRVVAEAAAMALTEQQRKGTCGWR